MLTQRELLYWNKTKRKKSHFKRGGTIFSLSTFCHSIRVLTGVNQAKECDHSISTYLFVTLDSNYYCISRCVLIRRENYNEIRLRLPSSFSAYLTVSYAYQKLR